MVGAVFVEAGPRYVTAALHDDRPNHDHGAVPVIIDVRTGDEPMVITTRA